MTRLYRRLSFFFCVPVFLLCGCETGSHEVSVYERYRDGNYETTLTEDNCFTRTDVEQLLTMLRTDTPVVALIGGPWCPYCASDIGIIDTVFKESPLSQLLSCIYYVDVADSQISNETIMLLDNEFDWYVRTQIPCLIAARSGTLLADYGDFKEIENRTDRIVAFFETAEKNIV